MKLRTHPISALVIAHIVASYGVVLGAVSIAAWVNELYLWEWWVIVAAPLSVPIGGLMQYLELLSRSWSRSDGWPLLMAVATYSAIFAVCFTRLIGFWDRPRWSGIARCVKCGYDLRATPFRCPECGEYSGRIGAVP